MRTKSIWRTGFHLDDRTREAAGSRNRAPSSISVTSRRTEQPRHRAPSNLSGDNRLPDQSRREGQRSAAQNNAGSRPGTCSRSQKCRRMFLLRAEGFFCSLDALSGGLGIGKLKFLIQKKFNFFICKFFAIFIHQNPGSGLDPNPDPDWSPASNAGSGSGSNEYGSETLQKLIFLKKIFCLLWYFSKVH